MNDSLKPPEHVAIIMDGNGRWAKSRGLNRLEGHKEGAQTVRRIVTRSRELGIKYLTLYSFSYENWGRPKAEIEGLFTILRKYCIGELPTMMKNGISFNIIGEWDGLPVQVRKVLKDTIDKTATNKKMALVLALNYSSRREIISAVNGLLASGSKRTDEKGFSRKLFTGSMPDPDLIIRTSGEMRLSNFLLWQAAYAEFHFSRTLWPDFTEEEYTAIIAEFGKRERRYGRI